MRYRTSVEAHAVSSTIQDLKGWGAKAVTIEKSSTRDRLTVAFEVGDEVTRDRIIDHLSDRGLTLEPPPTSR